jgi:hypothetical protein
MLFAFILGLSFFSKENYYYNTSKNVIDLNTSLLNNVYIEKTEDDNVEKVNNEEKEEKVVEKKDNIIQEKKNVVSNQTQTAPASTVVDSNPTPAQTQTQTLDSVYVGLKFTGSMTAYGKDCCGSDPARQGITSSGYDLKQSLTYNDPTYGSVRIVASDKNFKLYSIIQVNDPIDGSYKAIVLDRAGSVIGLNKTKKFDLAVESEAYAASSYGVHKNVSFEVLRVGR